MLTRWLTLTALLAASSCVRAAMGHGSMTVGAIRRVKGHPEKELTLHCRDEEHDGVVQYWYTPFGHLETPGLLGKLDPVFMHHDGSLVIPTISLLHSGLYYCLLQHKQGTTLWPYELQVGDDNEKEDKNKSVQGSNGPFRFRRDAGPKERTQGGVSNSQFAGAVAASVLLTFVLGFSAGALTRTRVLRCLQAVTSKLSSRRQTQCQPDTLDCGSKVTIAALPPMCDNQAFEMEQVLEDDSVNCGNTESTISSTTSSPPAKPKRSFRQKREEVQEATAYLEGCDYKGVEEEEGNRLKENNKQYDAEAIAERGFTGFYISEKGGESQTETDEDECSEDQEEKDGREEEGAGELNTVGNGHNSRGSEDKTDFDKEKEREDEKEDEEGWREEREQGDRENKREKDEDTDISSPDEETDDETQGDTMNKSTEEDEEGGGVGEPSGSQPSRGRRSRVIRLYQYDEEGQRYGHLPDPAPEEQGPAPKLKQRSLSLTRLSAIMAAASAGPIETGETRGEERVDRQHFHMDI